ncbi:MAG: hypothetical protein EZS28_008304 [Streblomastix strix]|uniref:Uncharacterized protein n=1 Tax=Streblomastix strix TaxID=222440 RepID=A0A5J4WNF5_9EUKA|nr:MAG: hypothetical protein EZS28_008304 [Streblomastix strix]
MSSSQASIARTQLRKFFFESIGVDKRKIKPGNVQPRQHWPHEAETRHWRIDNIWPSYELRPYLPAEGTHVYIELAKAISTI